MGLYTHVDFLRMTSTYRLLIKNQDHLIEIYDYLISNFFFVVNWINHATRPDLESAELEGRAAVFNQQEIFR